MEWKPADKAFFFNTVDTVSNNFPIDGAKGFFINMRIVPAAAFTP